MTYLEKRHQGVTQAIIEPSQAPELEQAQGPAQGPVPSTWQGPVPDAWQAQERAQDRRAAP